MKGIILWQSKYGATKRYADWLAEETGFDCTPAGNAKIEEVMNKALRESSEKIDENNRILDAQKKNIIRIMGEANKFRNSLIQSYKQHLNIINSMSKAEDFKKQQKELDEKFPPAEGNRPVVLSGADSDSSSEDSADISSDNDISSSSSNDMKE